MTRPLKLQDFDILIFLAMIIVGFSCCWVFYNIVLIPIIHDAEMPKNAITFAYEGMSDKPDVIFVEKHVYREGVGITFFVVDSEGKDYRVQWSGVYNSLELNKSYDIRYQIYGQKNINDKIWEIKANNTKTRQFDLNTD